MKKIAIVSCYFHKNYGSMLQAYATQKIVDELGYENETIYCGNPQMYMTQSKFKYYFRKLTNKDVLVDKLRRSKVKIKEKMPNSSYSSDVKVRNKKFEEFSQNRFRVTGKYTGREELVKDITRFDIVLVGSDQLWSPANIDNDYYTLTFVPDEIPKIAYATSFGVSSLPEYQKDTAKSFLERFSAISVREKAGADIVEQAIGERPRVVVDPTLLFTADAWKEIQPRERIVKESYIFCYFLGNNPIHREFAEKVKKETGMKIVVLQHMDEYIKSDETFGDIKPYDVGPGEFVNLIRFADYVCTDSFHGTVFSIIHQRKFFTFNRFMNKNKISTNSRIDNLLGCLGLENRRKTGAENVSECLAAEIDYERIFTKLESMRKESRKYLEDAISAL